MEIDYYRKGRTYEIFIRKVFNCPNGKSNGAEQSLMVNLFLVDPDKNPQLHYVPYERQFFKVKLNIEKAIIKLKKRKKYVDSYEHFSPLLVKLNRASNANDLMKVVNAGLSKIIELENQMRRPV